MLPKPVKWPIQFTGFAIVAWVLVQAAKLGYRLGGGGIEGFYWGGVSFLLAMLAVGLILYAIRRVLSRLAIGLMRRVMAELEAQERGANE